jgi:IclR family pca regulon transcriptional regulator
MLKEMPRHKLTPHTRTSIPDIMREIRRVRALGYAVNDQEVEIGLRSIAVPVRNRNDQIVAAVSQQLSDPAASLKQLLTTALPEIQRTRNRIASFL